MEAAEGAQRVWRVLCEGERGGGRAHIQQVLDVHPNLDISLVRGRLLGVEPCLLLDLCHGHGQRLGAGVPDEERRHGEGKGSHRSC